VSLAHSHYRDLDTLALLAAVETLSWDRAHVAAEPDAWAHPESTADFLDVCLADGRAELGRRERLRNRPFAPAWPDRTAELADIKRRIDLADFVEKHSPVQFARRGRQLVACCPLPGHRDDSPSFVLNPEKQVFYCHGCLRGGDVFNFTLALLDCRTFADAVDFVAREAGVERRTPRHALRIREVRRA
jgi:CHC2 zinc finger